MNSRKPKFQIGDRARVVGSPHIRGRIIKILEDATGEPRRAELVWDTGVICATNRFDLAQLELDVPAPVPGTKGRHKATGLEVEVVSREAGGGQDVLTVKFSAGLDEFDFEE